MRKYMREYMHTIDLELQEKKIFSQADLDAFYRKITFFQHERLVHLLVTLFYGLFLILSAFVTIQIPLFGIIVLIITVVLIFYVYHYFALENGVQYMYHQYDQMKKLQK